MFRETKAGSTSAASATFQTHLKLAQQGNAIAQNYVGYCYGNGKEGVAKDSNLALAWYQKAANQGEADGQYNLGLCYYNGQGVKQDLSQAVAWYQKAANQGQVTAQYSLGLCYDNGQGVKLDEGQAVAWYKKAADQGMAAAQCNLGTCYANGQGVKQDWSQAVAWYQKAANQGQVNAQHSLGVCYENGRGVKQDLSQAVVWYQKAADQGNAGARTCLEALKKQSHSAVSSAAPIRVETKSPQTIVTKPTAFEIELKRAQQGNAQAQAYVADCYQEGTEGIVKNVRLAVAWYKKAAIQGDADAQRNLGGCYENGLGIKEDTSQAVAWYTKAADQGHADAQYDLGRCYENGDGIEEDAAQAVAWYTKAADQGHAGAQYDLGRCYEDGEGVKQDFNQAVAWYKKAAAKGDKEASARVEALKKQGYSAPVAPAHAETKDPKTTSLPAAVHQATGELRQSTSFVSAKLQGNQRVEHKNDSKAEVKSDAPVSVSLSIPYRELTLGKELGRGGFGVVYQGTWRFNDVAIKQLLSSSTLSASAVEEFKAETQIMATLRSPNIVQFYGCCVSPQYSIVMEYMPKGSLYGLLHSKQTLEWPLRYQIATDMACGLAFLHAENILHRDFKSLNVLLDDRLRAKLIDFGLAKVKTETRTTSKGDGAAGTLAWMAPELFKRKATYTQKADIYSLGVTFWEIAARKIPYADASSPALIPTWVQQGEREEVPEDCPKKLASLIRFCWEDKPESRPTAAQVVKYLKSSTEDFTQFAASDTPAEPVYRGNLDSTGSAGAAGSGYVGNLDLAASFGLG